MDSRERVLTTLAGGCPDRVPVALSFFHIDLEETAPPGAHIPCDVDVRFVQFQPSASEEDFGRFVERFPAIHTWAVTNCSAPTPSGGTTLASQEPILWPKLPLSPISRLSPGPTSRLSIAVPRLGNRWRCFTRQAMRWPAVPPTWAGSCSRPPGG